MFCKKCGNELSNNQAFCDKCGEPIDADALHAESAVKDSRNEAQLPHSFEYARTTVRNELAQVAVDSYESLGYELTGQRISDATKQTTLSFRRNRKVRGKAQLAKIQRSMDDIISTLDGLEKVKTRKASQQAIVIGVISALILGVGMCCTMVWTNLMVPGIVIGVIGIIGCLFAYLRYRKICAQETARINPEIESAYDRLATHCEEAQTILFGQEAKSM